jgi:hypothetical protein
VSRRLLLILGLIATSASAQQGRVQLNVTLASNPATDGPTVTVANVLSQQNTRELIRSGYTTQLHFRVELWRKSRWFADPAGADEWDILVSYDPAAQTYQLLRQHGKEREHVGLASLDSVESLVDDPVKSTLRPDRSGRYFYNASIDIQPLSVGDLDAALDWLRGPGQSAVKGKENVATAFLKGIELVVSRLVGGQLRHFEHASGIFEVP